MIFQLSSKKNHHQQHRLVCAVYSILILSTVLNVREVSSVCEIRLSVNQKSHWICLRGKKYCYEIGLSNFHSNKY